MSPLRGKNWEPGDEKFASRNRAGGREAWRVASAHGCRQHSAWLRQHGAMVAVRTLHGHHARMSESGLRGGEVFLDARGGGRAMRLTWHHEADLVVMSIWRDRVCAGTFRLALSDVDDFVDALVDGLREAPGVHMSRSAAGQSNESSLQASSSFAPQQRGGTRASRPPQTGQVQLPPPAPRRNAS